MDAGLAGIEAPGSRRGAAVLVEVLRSEGVRHVFGNPGMTELPLVDALTGAPDIAYVLGLHEAAVVAMAEGYARTSGRPGFVNLHTAGGLGHAMGAILNAQVARTPLVVTAGQQDTRHGFTDPIPRHRRLRGSRDAEASVGPAGSGDGLGPLSDTRPPITAAPVWTRGPRITP